MDVKLLPCGGMDNASDVTMLDKNSSGMVYVRDAVNVDISKEGKMKLRQSGVKVSDVNYQSLWQSSLHGDVFGRLGSEWVLDQSSIAHSNEESLLSTHRDVEAVVQAQVPKEPSCRDFIGSALDPVGSNAANHGEEHYIELHPLERVDRSNTHATVVISNGAELTPKLLSDLVGLGLWALGHFAAVWAAKRDPQFVDVVRKHLRIPGHLSV